MKNSIIKNVTSNISIGCISPEARDLLDRIMEEWEKHYSELKKVYEQVGRNEEPGYYAFAYWLVRWSGLIQPS
jgi:hypothetical protein